MACAGYKDKYYLWGVFKRKDSDNKNISETSIIPEANEKKCTKQADHNSPIKSYKEMPLDNNKEEQHENTLLCTLTDMNGDREMMDYNNNLEADEELLDGCLELFPTHVENIALRLLSTGDEKKGVDLELGLSLPFRR